MKTMKNTLMGLVVASAAIMTSVNAQPASVALRGTSIEAGAVSHLAKMPGMEPVVLEINRLQADGKLDIQSKDGATALFRSLATSVPGLSAELKAQLNSDSLVNEVMATSNAFKSSTSDYTTVVGEESAADVFGAVSAVQDKAQCELEAIGNGKVALTAEQRDQAGQVAANLDAFMQTLVVSGKLKPENVPAFRDQIKALYGVGNGAATADGSVSEAEALQLQAGMKILTDSLADAVAVRAALNGEFTVDCGLYDAYTAAAAGKGQTAVALSASAAAFVGACGSTFGGGKLTAENAAATCAR